MDRFRIEYSVYGAERIRENVRRNAIEGAFEDILIKTDDVINYLTHFLHEFEYAQRSLSSQMDNICCRIDELRKNGRETNEYQAYLARLGDLKTNNEYRLREIRDRIKQLTDFREGVERAVFWSKELAETTDTRLLELIESMERYMSARARTPDTLHRQVSRIGKLTDGEI